MNFFAQKPDNITMNFFAQKPDNVHEGSQQSFRCTGLYKTHPPATLTKVSPYIFVRCMANARV